MAPFLPPKQRGGWLEVSKIAWLCVLYVAILGNCLSSFLWVKGVQDIGPLRTILYQYLTPRNSNPFCYPVSTRENDIFADMWIDCGLWRNFHCSV